MKETLESINEAVINGYTEYSGIQITEIGEGYAEGRIDISARHLNPSGAVHGGAIFCLGDVVGGVAFRTQGGLPVTLSSDITYFRPFIDDKVIYARADVIKRGKTTSFVEIRILNEKKIECARIAATYYNVEGRVKA